MNNQFDELTKSVAQSVTRRAALKKFGAGLAGMALACLGLANRAEAANRVHGQCQVYYDAFTNSGNYTGMCVDPITCQQAASSRCKGTVSSSPYLASNTCSTNVTDFLDTKKACSF